MAYRPDAKPPATSQVLGQNGDELDDALLDNVTGGTDTTGGTTTITDATTTDTSNIMKTKHDTVKNSISNIR